MYIVIQFDHRKERQVRKDNVIVTLCSLGALHRIPAALLQVVVQ
jgi:hypothetical protein